MRAGSSILRHVPLSTAVGYLGLVYFFPIALLGSLAFSNGAAGLREFWASPAYMTILNRTLIFATQITVITLLLSYPLAYAARTRGPAVRIFVLAVSTIPLWISALVRNYAWLLILSRRGVINSVLRSLGLSEANLIHNTAGTMIAGVYVMMPFMVLVLYAGMNSIDLANMRAARTLGARPAQAFFSIFLPQSFPAILSACLLVFITALGFFITPVLLGGPGDMMFSMLIADQIQHLGNFAAAAGLCIVFLVICFAIFLLLGTFVGFDQLAGRKRHGASKFQIEGRWTQRMGHIRPLAAVMELPHLLNGYVVLAAAFLLLPLIVIVPISFSASTYLEFPPRHVSLQWYKAIFFGPDWLGPGLTSVVAGAAAAFIAVVVSVLAALGLRSARPSASRAVLPLLLAPMLVPTMIYSVGAYYAAARIGAVDSIWGIALAHSALCVLISTEI